MKRLITKGMSASSWALALVLTASAEPRDSVQASDAQEPEARAASCLTAATVTERVEFATLAQAKAILSEPDDWARQLSAFDRGVRQQSLAPTSTREFLEFLGNAAAAWSPEELAYWESLVDRLGGAMSGLDLALPDVFMVKTTGEEEFNAAYSRNDSIMLPQGSVKVSGDESRLDFFLLAHEMFHLVSGENPRQRDALYALLGFRRVENFVYPAELEDRRLSNPDAGGESYGYALSVRTAAGLVDVVPVIQSTLPLEKVIELIAEGSHIFNAIETVLLPVDADTGEVLRDSGGKLIQYRVDATDWESRMQRNSTYTIHPDELLADNFALLMEWRSTGVQPVDRPGGFAVNDVELLKSIEELLTARCGE